MLDYAAEHERVIVAADTDFGALLARRAASKPPFVLFRRQTRGRRPADQAALLLAHVLDIDRDLEDGAVVVVEEGRIRVRRFPINP